MTEENRVEGIVHLVWTSDRCRPVITPDIERPLCQCVAVQVRRLGGDVLALGGMPNQIHLLARLPPTIPIDRLVQRVRDASLRLARDLAGGGRFPGWGAYGIVWVSREEIPQVVTYIRDRARRYRARVEGDEEERILEEALWRGR